MNRSLPKSPLRTAAGWEVMISIVDIQLKRRSQSPISLLGKGALDPLKPPIGSKTFLDYLLPFLKRR